MGKHLVIVGGGAGGPSAAAEFTSVSTQLTPPSQVGYGFYLTIVDDQGRFFVAELLKADIPGEPNECVFTGEFAADLGPTFSESNVRTMIIKSHNGCGTLSDDVVFQKVGDGSWGDELQIEISNLDATDALLEIYEAITGHPFYLV